MADLNIAEIEELVERLERRRKAHQFFAERVTVETGKKAHSEASDDFEEAASALRQLLSATEWKPIETQQFYEEREAMKALRGKLSKRATSSEFNEWMAREICEYIDALLTKRLPLPPSPLIEGE
jgi:thioesterase domain-containing protein